MKTTLFMFAALMALNLSVNALGSVPHKSLIDTTKQAAILDTAKKKKVFRAPRRGTPLPNGEASFSKSVKKKDTI